MAVDAPLLKRQSILAAKVETTTGTDVTPAAADAAMNIFDAKMKNTSDVQEREGQSALSMLPPVPGALMGEVEFETELVGHGSAASPLWATTFLAASGFGVSSLTWTPQSGSASYTTLTTSLYQDGRLKKLTGCTFDSTWTIKAGACGRAKWKGQGAWVAPASASLLTPTYPTVIPPRFAAATLTIGAVAYKISEIEIAFGNEIAYREDANSATGSGIHSTAITNRKITVKVDPEATAFATIDWYAGFAAGTTYALNVVLGSSAGNIITIAAPKLAIMAPPEDDDRDGLLIDKLEFVCVRNAAAGDDEISVVFS